jgi:hypothetical protein
MLNKPDRNSRGMNHNIKKKSLGKLENSIFSRMPKTSEKKSIYNVQTNNEFWNKEEINVVIF